MGYTSADLGGQSAGSPIPVALGLIEDRENDPIFSAASLWEIGIKHQPGRTDFAAVQDCFDGSCVRTDTGKSG
jgi:hypothetical protein